MTFNNFKLFRWNSDNINYTKDDNLYNDVYLHTGTRVKGEWENSISTIYVENELKIISNSNYFIAGNEWGILYNNLYKIYDNIVRNYTEIANTNNTELEDYIYFNMIDPFSFSNSGHNLSYILNCVDYIIKHNITHILVLEGYQEMHNFKLISKILPSNCIIIELKLNHIYKIKNIIIIDQVIMNIFNHKYLINSLIDIIKNEYSNIYDDLKHKNVILMKTNRNEGVMDKHTQILCEKFLLNLEDKGWIYLYPEKLDIFQLCIYLLFADKIIFSTGSILYTNKIFFNNEAKLIYITFKHHINSCTDGILHKIPLIIYQESGNLDNQNYLEIIDQIEQL